jgi:hypothetical protein
MRATRPLTVLLLLACGPRQLQVTMNPDNNSGQAGSATLTEAGTGKTRVVVSIGKSDVPDAEPAHIHFGHCGMIGDKKSALVSLLPDQKDPSLFSSDSTVNFDFSELTTGAYALNVHDSRDITLYVSCGDLRLGAGQ